MVPDSNGSPPEGESLDKEVSTQTPVLDELASTAGEEGVDLTSLTDDQIMAAQGEILTMLRENLVMAFGTLQELNAGVGFFARLADEVNTRYRPPVG